MKHGLRTTAYKHESNHGSALITVLVVLTVLMVIVLSVLSISYQYFMEEVNGMYEQKCQETTYSLAQELKSEIAGKKYNSYEEQESSNNELWKYLRETIAQNADTSNAWPYYEAGTTERKESSAADGFVYDIDSWKAAGSLEEARRYFKIEPTSSGNTVLNEELPITSVCMYWEPGKYTDRVDGIRLHVAVTCQMGDYSYTIRDVYKLGTEAYMNSDPDQSVKVNGRANPDTMIYKNEEWEWSYEGEE